MEEDHSLVVGLLERDGTLAVGRRMTKDVILTEFFALERVTHMVCEHVMYDVGATVPVECPVCILCKDQVWRYGFVAEDAIHCLDGSVVRDFEDAMTAFEYAYRFETSSSSSIRTTSVSTRHRVWMVPTSFASQYVDGWWR